MRLRPSEFFTCGVLLCSAACTGGQTGSEGAEGKHEPMAGTMTTPPDGTTTMGPTTAPPGGMGMGDLPPPCVSDEQCRMDAQEALAPLRETRAVERRLVHAECARNPCGGSRSQQRRTFCGCVADTGDERGLEGYSLGGFGDDDCDVVGRPTACLFWQADYEPCDAADPASCNAQCETVARAADADDARARDVEVRYAACVEWGRRLVGSATVADSQCLSVVRIDDQCYFSQYYPAFSPEYPGGYLVPAWYDGSWDCALSDAEIVAKYYPTLDLAAFECTQAPTGVGCPPSDKSGGGWGGCSVPTCLDPACYSDAGLDLDLPSCSCEPWASPDEDAGL